MAHYAPTSKVRRTAIAGVAVVAFGLVGFAAASGFADSAPTGEAFPMTSGPT